MVDIVTNIIIVDVVVNVGVVVGTRVENPNKERRSHHTFIHSKESRIQSIHVP